MRLDVHVEAENSTHFIFICLSSYSLCHFQVSWWLFPKLKKKKKCMLPAHAMDFRNDLIHLQEFLVARLLSI